MLKNERRFSMSCRPEIRTMFARTRASLWSKVLERDRMAATHIFDAPPEGVAADWTMPQKWSAFTAEQHETWRSLFDRQSAALDGYACRAFLDGLDILRQLQPRPEERRVGKGRASPCIYRWCPSH